MSAGDTHYLHVSSVTLISSYCLFLQSERNKYDEPLLACSKLICGLSWFSVLTPPVAATLCLKALTLLLIFSWCSDYIYLLIKFVQTIFSLLQYYIEVCEHCAFNINLEKVFFRLPPHELRLCTFIHTAISHAILCKPIPNSKALFDCI